MSNYKTIFNNKKVKHQYEILSQYEAGIQLVGSEVKSLRASQCSIAEAWIKVQNQEAWLIGATIQPYLPGGKGTWTNHEPARSRKLLLHKKEIMELHQELTQQRRTILPLEIYFNDKGMVKLKIAVVTAKKYVDKRHKLEKKDLKKYGYGS